MKIKHAVKIAATRQLGQPVSTGNRVKRPRDRVGRLPGKRSLIDHALAADPAASYGTVRVMMGLVDNSSLIAPDVFAVDGHRVVGVQRRDSGREIGVVGDQQCLSRLQSNQEFLVAASNRVIRQFPNDGSTEFDHETAGLQFECPCKDAVAGAERAGCC